MADAAPETLIGQTATLEASLEGLFALGGSAGSDTTPGTGLAGATALVDNSTLTRTDALSDALATAAPTFDSGSLAAPVAAVAKMAEAVSAPPAAALSGFDARIKAVEAELLGDAPAAAVATAAKSVAKIADAVPAQPGGLAPGLVDQVVGAFRALDGPEAETIHAWSASLGELRDGVAPKLAAAGDPLAAAVEIVKGAINATVRVFGLDDAQALVSSLQRLIAEPLDAARATQLDAAFARAQASMSAAAESAFAGTDELREKIPAVDRDLLALQAALAPVATVLERVAGHPLLAPGTLRFELGKVFEHALGVHIADAAKIDEPYKALLGRIEKAVDAIDVDATKAQALGSLKAIGDELAAPELKQASEALRDGVKPLEAAVDKLDAGVTVLRDDLKAHVAKTATTIQRTAEGVGAYSLDGTFTFSFAPALDSMYGDYVRVTLNNPAKPTFADSIRKYGVEVADDGKKAVGMLDSVAHGIETAATSVPKAIGDFTDFLAKIDIPALLEKLRKAIDELVHLLTPIKFATFVDPVIKALKDNTEKIKKIDASKLDSITRAALSVALDFVIAIDFTAMVKKPLDAQLVKAKKLPAALIADLQKTYNEALAELRALHPEKVLGDAFKAYDQLASRMEKLHVDEVLKRFDELYERRLKEPLAKTKPLTLFEPLTAHPLFGPDAVPDGTKLLAPAGQRLSELKEKVAAADLAKPAEAVLADLGRVDAKIRELQPATLVEPAKADLTRLETEIEKLRPSKVFEPAAALATPLLDAFAGATPATVETLHAAFQAPLAELDRLRPSAVEDELRAGIDAAIAAVEALRKRVDQLAGPYQAMRASAEARRWEERRELIESVDVQARLGPLLTAHDAHFAALRDCRRGLDLGGLAGQHDAVRARALELVPAYGRELLPLEDFKRLIALANPMRFADGLESRFEAVKQKLEPISPQKLTGALEAAHADATKKLDALDLGPRLQALKPATERAKEAVAAVRVDFVAGDLEGGVNEVRAAVAKVDPAPTVAALEEKHAEATKAVEKVKPSAALPNAEQAVAAVKRSAEAANPRAKLLPPLLEAWKKVDGQLTAVDLSKVLSPIAARMDELEADFLSELARTEAAFDEMLGAARSVLRGAG